MDAWSKSIQGLGAGVCSRSLWYQEALHRLRYTLREVDENRKQEHEHEMGKKKDKRNGNPSSAPKLI